MKKNLQTLIFLEDSYHNTEIIQGITKTTKNFIIIGHAHSELKLIRMLKEFLPDILIIKTDMISYEFLLKLHPLLNNSPVKLLVYSTKFKDEIGINELIKKVKLGVLFSFFKLGEHDTSEILAEKINYQIKNIESKVPKEEKQVVLETPGLKKAEKLVIIGSSAGGPRILKNILLQMLDEVPAAIIIVQHIPFLFSRTLVQTLSTNTSKSMKEAEEGDILYDNHIYVAKGDYHLEVVKNGNDNALHLNQRAKLWSVRPAIDITMFSAIKIFGKRIVAAILTGIGHDGTEGIMAVKKAGGTVIAQNEETSMIFGMPKSAIESGCVDYILPYYKIADVCVQLIKEK
ncbi:MAG: chemotaxis protein CheB [Candidatus Aureabacteria bacterium]|nr:chemotaxis protein CheB [Candidatus Auribacterota bacterium]